MSIDQVSHPDGVQSDCGASIAAAAASVSSPPPVKVAGKPYLPFQLQIEFTAPDKSRYLRVVTNTKPFTSDLDQAERSMCSVDTSYMHTYRKDLENDNNCVIVMLAAMHMPVMGLHHNRMARYAASYDTPSCDMRIDQSRDYFERQRRLAYALRFNVKLVCY